MQQDIGPLYHEVMDFIENAMQAAGTEPVTNMDALNKQIEQLTLTINALPIEKRIEYRHDLGKLFQALKELEEKLTSRRNAIQGELGSQSAHRAANSAYSKTGTIGKVEN